MQGGTETAGGTSFAPGAAIHSKTIERKRLKRLSVKEKSSNGDTSLAILALFMNSVGGR